MGLLLGSEMIYGRKVILPQMSFCENVFPIMKQNDLQGSYYAARWSTPGKSYYLKWISENMFFQLWSKIIYGAPSMQQTDLWPERHTTSNEFLRKCFSNYEAKLSMGPLLCSRMMYGIRYLLGSRFGRRTPTEHQTNGRSRVSFWRRFGEGPERKRAPQLLSSPVFFFVSRTT